MFYVDIIWQRWHALKPKQKNKYSTIIRPEFGDSNVIEATSICILICIS